MKNGQCPKCKSSNVFKSKDGFSMGGHSVTLAIFSGSLGSMPASCDSYVCTECGYFENYIISKDRLQEVQKNWTKVT